MRCARGALTSARGGPISAPTSRASAQNDLCFGIGPAGTGKTYLAVASAVEAMEQERVRRIVLVRPAVEAGERLGFLPGDLAQKVDPYLRPMYDALYEMLGFDRVARLVERNIIEVAPLAYMRGRSLNESFIILDEAQNTSVEQMKMFLTRMGFGSRVVVTGDITQVDLPRRQVSGLRHVMQVLEGVPGVSFTFFSPRDVVRHALVQRIVEAYEAREAADRAEDGPGEAGRWAGTSGKSPDMTGRRPPACEVQVATRAAALPAGRRPAGWVAAAGARGRGTVTVRLVGWPESRRLNENFRGKTGADQRAGISGRPRPAPGGAGRPGHLPAAGVPGGRGTGQEAAAAPGAPGRARDPAPAGP